MIAPRHPKPHTPTFRLHKATGQGYVELDGRRLYLGLYHLPQTRLKYHQLLAEWLANGRQMPVDPQQISVAEVVNRFRKHVEQHYRKPDGTPTSEQHNIRDAARPLLTLYSDTRAAGFGPRALKTVRQAMIDLGWCRKHVNKQVGRIRLLFKWAAENELLPAETWHGLLAVSGLRLGRTEARESQPVQPVAEAVVEATLQHATPTLAAMVRLQLLTGMRPMEVCLLRTGDLDTSGRVWLYQPHRHKTEHHGHKRQILVGPRAQEVVRPFLLADLQAYVFSPARSETERRASLHARRKTPLRCGNAPGSHRKQQPERTPGLRYDTAAYGAAIDKCCDAVFPPPEPLAKRSGETHRQWQDRLDDRQKAELRAWRKAHRWSPNQLRHTFATRVRRKYGIDVAQSLMGHRLGSMVTEVYAEKDTARAMAIVLSVG